MTSSHQQTNDRDCGLFGLMFTKEIMSSIHVGQNFMWEAAKSHSTPLEGKDKNCDFSKVFCLQRNLDQNAFTCWDCHKAVFGLVFHVCLVDHAHEICHTCLNFNCPRLEKDLKSTPPFKSLFGHHRQQQENFPPVEVIECNHLVKHTMHKRFLWFKRI